MAFYVGQKVVCVEAGPLKNRFGNVFSAPELVVGRDYTICGIEVNGGVHVREVDLSRAHWSGFNPRRFRPVVERKTDISIFQAMLNPSREEVSA